MTRLAFVAVAALFTGVLTTSAAMQLQSGPPAVPHNLETWSYYDEMAEQTENGLNLDAAGKRTTMSFSIVVRHERRLTNTPPKSIKFQFVTGGDIVNTQYRPTLTITLNAGKPDEATLNYSSRLAPLTSDRGGNRSTEWVLVTAGEVRALGTVETVRIAVFGDTYELVPKQIDAIKRFADRVSLK